MNKFFKVSIVLLFAIVPVLFSGCISAHTKEEEPTIKVKHKYPDGVTQPEYAFV